MKLLDLALLILLAAMLPACQSSRGPAFDPRAEGDPTGVARTLAMTNASDLEEKAFASFPRDPVKPEMLRAPKDLYRLGPGDSVTVEIPGEANSQVNLIVGPDGKVYYQLLPGTMVWGLALNEVKAALETGLKKFVRVPPDLTVTLRQANSRNVWVLGNVATPGLYPLATPCTVLEAITLAGGTLISPGSPDGFCDLQRSFLMREGKLVPVDFDKLLRGGDLSQNVFLQPNDFLYLRSGVTRNVYVLGAVALPNMVPYSDQLTLAGAILSAGGPVQYAYVSQVAIVRGGVTQPRIATVDFKQVIRGQAPDVRLQPGDIVYVPYVPWRKLAILAESVIDAFVLNISANEGYRIAYPNSVPTGPVVPVGTSTPSTPTIIR
jgi:polysaccharide biosynthesis/export protein